MAVSVLRELLAILWRERDLLELLESLYRRGRKADAGGPASREAYERRLQNVLEAVANAELQRAILTRTLAGQLGLEDYPSLTRLVELCPPNWAGILSEHRQALRAAVARIDDLVATDTVLRIVDPGAESPFAPGLPPQPIQRSLVDFLS